MGSDAQRDHQTSPNRQTVQVISGLVLGIALGGLLHQAFSLLPPEHIDTVISLLGAITEVFMRMVKMIIAPLVFATLVVGMAHIGDGNTLGRIGGKAIGWFLSASITSLLLGMALVNLLAPGKGLQLPLPPAGSQTGLEKASLTLSSFVAHLVPRSIVEAMAQNEILEIVVFSTFFGIACAHLGSLAKPVVTALDSLSHIMLKITSYVMKFAPLAVFAAMAAVIARQGLGVILTYGLFLCEFYLALMLLWCVLALVGYFFLGARTGSLIRHIREPMLVAFGTASSEAAYPLLLRQLGRFGCSEQISGLVLPLGYSFNLDGSMMYMTFAVLFIAQAYGIEMPLSDQFLMLLVLLFTSKGVAGVPRASLIVISGTLELFHIPEAGLLLLLGIDQILDMGRSATNVLGNSLATAVISHWESRHQKSDMPDHS